MGRVHLTAADSICRLCIHFDPCPCGCGWGICRAFESDGDFEWFERKDGLGCEAYEEL